MMRFSLSTLAFALSTSLLYAAALEDPTESGVGDHPLVGRVSPTAEGSEVADLLQAVRLSSSTPAETDSFQRYEDLIQDWSLQLACDPLTPGAYAHAVHSVTSSLTTTLTSLVHDLRESRKALRAFRDPVQLPRVYLLTDQEAAETHLRERLRWEQVEDKLTFLGGEILPTFRNLWAKREKTQKALGALPPAFDFVEEDEGFNIYERLVDKWATQFTEADQQSTEEYGRIAEEVEEEIVNRLSLLMAGRRELEETIRQLSTDEELEPQLYPKSSTEEATDFLTQLDVEALVGQDLSEKTIGKFIGDMYRTALLAKFRTLFEGNEALMQERDALLSSARPYTE